MDELIVQETEVLTQLESGGLDLKQRRTLETKLDTIRESIGSSMNHVYDYVDGHSSKSAWRRSYTSKGFTNAQFLISSLMAKQSPLRSLLLYHGVGVGKTCAAIAAATDYKESRSILVLTPSQTLVKNWKQEFIGKNHCGRYIWNIPANTWKQMSERKRGDILRSHVSIMGYLTFANRVETMAKTYKEADDGMDDSYALIRAVRTLCNEKLIIMDEIHATRQQNTSKEADVKKIRPVLEAIARYGKQTKIILLSATPMYNEVSEIEWILNILRWNQGLHPVRNEMWLKSRTDEWKTPISRSKQYIADMSRGFISYIRGENPYTFPRRIDPPSDTFILNKEKGIMLTMSRLSPQMREHIDIMKQEEKDSFGVKMMQELISVQHKISHESEGDWSPDVCRDWSPKIWTAWEGIRVSKGPVFIYSQYLQHGIYEMAKVLEEMGWLRVEGKTFTSFAGKIDPYCWNNKCRRSEIAKQTNPLPFVQARYALVEGSTTNLYSVLSLMNDATNRDGSRCAALLGSRVIEVGVSLKRIRQVHILEPWFHLNSMEQAIGRAIRNRSHIDLPVEQRNLTIFLHCADEDTSDTKMYTTSIHKMQMMSQVSKLFAIHAIDCSIQKQLNYIRDSGVETIEDSFGNRLDTPKGDTDFSARCGYSTCEITCAGSHFETDIVDSDVEQLYSSLTPSLVFPTNMDIVIERVPSVLQGISAVDVDTIAESLGVSSNVAKKALDHYVVEKKRIGQGYLQKLEDSLYITSMYPQRVVPIEIQGVVPVKKVELDVRISSLPKPKLEATEKVEYEEEEEVSVVKGDIEVMDIIETFDRQLRMIEGLTPMRKSIEQKGSLEVANLKTDVAIRKQAAYQRYIGYADDRKAGEKKIARKELYSSIVVSCVEHLTAVETQVFLSYLVKTKDSSLTIQYLRDSLSENGLGLSVVPFLMKYETHIRPYIPSDERTRIDAMGVYSEKDINAFAYTEKKNCVIQIELKDGSWYGLTSAIVMEWKLALRPKIVRKTTIRKKDSIWIEAWIDPETYEFSLRIPRKDPMGTNPVSKKSKVLGGLCGQTFFVKNVEELVILLEKLSDIKYFAASKRITVGKKDLPSGIYWPRATGTDVLKSFYLGGVNKRPSKTSTGASLCEELEYVLRIIAYAGNSHPMSEWVRFYSSLEWFIQN